MDLFEKKSRKEAILSLRGKLGKSREECLAFAFLRGREYISLERTISQLPLPERQELVPGSPKASRTLG
jgi:hypothetical protein